MLTELQVKQAKPEAKPYKKADRNGLHLYVSPTGHKSWRFKYRHGGKEGRMVFGTYPDMSLAEAREVLDDTRKQLRQGIDPNVLKVRARLGVASAEGRTFESVAREWHEQQVDRWKPVHANDVITSMERDLFPDVGGCPVDQIDIAMMLAVLRKVEKRGAIETAHRLRQRAERVFRYARSIGIPNDNPAAELTEALKPVPKAKRWPALGSVEEIKPFLARIDLAGASPVTRLASRFLALVAQRPGMIRHAEWGEFKGIDWLDPASDVSNALWHIPAAKMKQELHLR
ncbi:MAG: integrase arm-type DNA-binding domain-containing protein, partial [Sphingomonadales bacterium]|nr:integrase arm-type DNA-binding domain-containing protein [Sphingomonadales bacterium]